jgi:hypothetical protein
LGGIKPPIIINEWGREGEAFSGSSLKSTGSWLYLRDVLMGHVLIMALLLTLDRDKQIELRFDDGMLNGT